MSEPSKPLPARLIFKKYPNRRIYCTASQLYVNHEYLARLVKTGSEFVIKDSKTDEDITQSVLTNVMFDQEGQTEQFLLPINFLRHLISFYGAGMSTLLPNYLDFAMRVFIENQEKFRRYMEDALRGINTFEKVGKKNMGIFETAISMFPAVYPGEAESRSETSEIEQLKSKIAQVQAQLDSLDVSAKP